MPRLIRIVDDAQRRRIDMSCLLQQATMMLATGRSGPSNVTDIVRRRLDGYSVPEWWFERLLSMGQRSPALKGIVRQHELRTPTGLFVARFDLAVPAVRLGIEGHSRSFHLGEAVERYDENRDMRAGQLGWQIAYLGFATTRSPAPARQDIELLVARRALDLGLVG